MQRVQLPKLRCYRCLYSWVPVRSPVRICPRCKSKYWDVPKLRPVKLGRGAGIREVIEPHRSEILKLARRHGATSVRVFGSVRRQDASESSDVDFLVDWKRTTSLSDHAALELALEQLLGRRVDVVSPEGLHWAIRPQVESEALPV
jgi:predicted nucleotidyltransferase